jgi:hypothetical protein
MQRAKKPFVVDNFEVGLNRPQALFMVFCRTIAGALRNLFNLKMAIKLFVLSQLV